MEENKKQTGNLDSDGPFAPGNEARPDKAQEKTSIGGAYNSGVTSSDPDTKDRINKQASLLKEQPGSASEKAGDDEAH